MELALFFLVALLYSSVGHAGASGYLAVMTLVIGLKEEAKPVALILNLIVASIGTLQFGLAKQIPWRQLWPFILGSMPLAYYGGTLTLGDPTYKDFVGVILLAASVRLLMGLPRYLILKPANDFLAIIVGAVIGILSGLTGTGGGIFLTPLLLFLGWAAPKPAAGVSVAFILANSAAGLAGRASSQPILLPSESMHWAFAAALGGLIGSWFGARRSGLTMLRRLLAVVLLIAASKLLAGE